MSTYIDSHVLIGEGQIAADQATN